MKDLSFRQLPRLAVAAGATTPAPSASSFIWSTTENSVLVWNGTQWVAIGGSGGGGGTTDHNALTNLQGGLSTERFHLSNAEVTKLSGIQTGATANSTDAQLRDRSTHAGTQPFTTITGTVPVNQGGTGLTSYTAGNFIRAADTTVIEQRTPAQVLTDIGAAAVSHTHTTANITDFNESARAQTEAMLVAGTNITLTPSGSGTTRQITVAASGTGGATDPLDLIARAAPTIPPANTVRLFGRSIATRMMPAYIGPSGLDSSLQPWLGRNKISWFNPPGNGTAVQTIGMTVGIVGAATAANVATTNIHQSMRRLEYAAATASLTAIAGVRNGVNQFYIGNNTTLPFGGFTFIARFGPSRGAASNATRRFFAGMTSTTGAPADSDPSIGTTWQNIICVGADATDANFQIMHRAGTSAVTKIDTGIPKAYADNTEMFELVLFAPPAQASPTVGYSFKRLSDNLIFTGTISTNLPAVSQLLSWQIWNSVGGTSSVIGVSVVSIYVETDY